MGVGAKICGLTTPETIDAAVSGGASFVGFMFFAKSPRNLTPEAANHLARPVRGKSRVVAVTVDPDDALLDQITAGLRPDFIQLHGRETPSRARDVAVRTGAGVIRAFGVSMSSDVDIAASFEDVVDYLMFDARPPSGSDLRGGLGARFDAALLSGRRFARPWFLAGGLDPWNVAEAIAVSGAPLVDVSSGVERGPGLKDPKLIQAFLEAVRRA